jgi:hypothetical protein
MQSLSEWITTLPEATATEIGEWFVNRVQQLDADDAAALVAEFFDS